MKADLVVIGAMKCATSSVCAFLEDHPDVFMVPHCEPQYFCDDGNFAKGDAWYEDHFSDRTSEKLCGEGSNSYSARALFPKAAERMAAYNPDLKLIYMVRDPMKRIVSAWVQNRTDSGDVVPPTVDRAVREMPDVFIGQSLYWNNLEPYRALFPERQIFVGFMEDLGRDPEAFFASLCAFLDITPKSARRGHQNPSTGKRVPGSLYSAVNGLTVTRLLKSVTPKTLRTKVKHQFLSKEADKLSTLSPSVRAEVLVQVQPDARRLLHHYGKPDDFWNI